ncbi:hypothetical protein J437_LFUL005778 [Ladona fulva]|uniref:Peptidase C45 hydrolase domain-containing protein n=1 Tax=Ladona fulva TaxID=123851 RepID=A0A8K0K4U4_LADFU|nr:hypothetical protein J437_LFUL005778 [Ladona fulva]
MSISDRPSATRFFLTRALLAAENMVQAQQILRDEGTGAGDAVSVNMTFLNQEGNRLFHNAEVGPAIIGENPPRSQLNILTASPGENIYHCNKYLRLKVPEVDGMIITSSDRRHAVMDNAPSPTTKQDVINILGDDSDKEYPIYREGKSEDFVKTIATGKVIIEVLESRCKAPHCWIFFKKIEIISEWKMLQLH